MRLSREGGRGAAVVSAARRALPVRGEAAPAVGSVRRHRPRITRRRRETRPTRNAPGTGKPPTIPAPEESSTRSDRPADQRPRIPDARKCAKLLANFATSTRDAIVAQKEGNDTAGWVTMSNDAHPNAEYTGLPRSQHRPVHGHAGRAARAVRSAVAIPPTCTSTVGNLADSYLTAKNRVVQYPLQGGSPDSRCGCKNKRAYFGNLAGDQTAHSSWDR
jgi:hypothetical protein